MIDQVFIVEEPEPVEPLNMLVDCDQCGCSQWTKREGYDIYECASCGYAMTSDEMISYYQ